VIIDGAPVSIGREARLQRQVIPASLPAGAADPFSAMWKARRTTCSSRAKISSLTKMCCSIVLEVPSSALEAKEVGLWARTLAPGDGGGWIQVERGARLRKRSYLSKKEMPTSEVNRRTMGVSLLLRARSGAHRWI